MKKLAVLFIMLSICCLCAAAWAADKKPEAEGVAPAAVITVEEMEQQLQTAGTEDVLYVKINDRVEVYRDLASSRSLRKQLVLALPNTEMLRLYTANKAAYEQMSKMLLDYEKDNANFNGYKIITDKDNPRTLDNGTTVYRFWFMKIEREKASRRGGFPIGVGIGIGGGRHHHGPWIGVGW